ncbi:glycoside hydrolase family 43 protein [Xylariaceae sp. FL0804]|nr:glycoside hydrolase family 43 protein [Xylariaceae sp. FL0804]
MLFKISAAAFIQLITFLFLKSKGVGVPVKHDVASTSGYGIDPVFDENFPDPSILWDEPSNTWYAFGSEGNGHQIQVATAPGSIKGPWTLLDQDLMPDPPAWTTGRQTWAPDVRPLASGAYVMYFSAQLANNTMRHCIGAATAPASAGPLGPWTFGAEPWACPYDEGGAIDASGFTDARDGGRQYVAYKVDANSEGGGGPCGNEGGGNYGDDTPILLQEVDPRDGVTQVGDATPILHRVADDGPLIEAPSLALALPIPLPPANSSSNSSTRRRRDTATNSTTATIPDDTEYRYLLFFSSWCYSGPLYDVKVAVASDVRGPYTRVSNSSLLRTGSLGLTSPGGATALTLPPPPITPDGGVGGGGGGGGDVGGGGVGGGKGRRGAVQAPAPVVPAPAIAWHADCDQGRCLHTAELRLGGKDEVELVLL